MPTTDRLGPHEHAAPPVTRKHSGKRGNDHPISWLATRSGHLPAKDRQLVTQDEYLDLVRGV